MPAPSATQAAPSSHLQRRAPHLFGMPPRSVHHVTCKLPAFSEKDAQKMHAPRTSHGVSAFASVKQVERTANITVSIIHLYADLCDPIDPESLACHWENILEQLTDLYAQVIPTLSGPNVHCRTTLAPSLGDWINSKFPRHIDTLRQRSKSVKSGTMISNLVALADDLKDIHRALYCLHQTVPECLKDEGFIHLFERIVHAQVSDSENGSSGETNVSGHEICGQHLTANGGQRTGDTTRVIKMVYTHDAVSPSLSSTTHSVVQKSEASREAAQQSPELGTRSCQDLSMSSTMRPKHSLRATSSSGPRHHNLSLRERRSELPEEVPTYTELVGQRKSSSHGSRTTSILHAPDRREIDHTYDYGRNGRIWDKERHRLDVERARVEAERARLEAEKKEERARLDAEKKEERAMWATERARLSAEREAEGAMWAAERARLDAERARLDAERERFYVEMKEERARWDAEKEAERAKWDARWRENRA